MSLQGNVNVEFKIAPQESLSIIGSNSIDTAGDLYTLDVNSVNKPSNRRKKRIIDIAFSFLFIALLPVLIFVVKNPLNYIANIFKVIFGFNSWVGYGEVSSFKFQVSSLNSRKGILSPVDSLKSNHISPEVAERLNKIYAKDYSVKNDVNILLKGIRNLGRA